MLECEACGARWLTRSDYEEDLVAEVMLDDLLPDADGTCPVCGGSVKGA